MDPDQYWVASAGPETEIKIKGSRFLGRVFPAPTWEAVKGEVAAVAKAHYSATHHCWAARVGLPGEVEARFDDDGEPSGTAGAPILQHLERAEWHAVLCVVTRYYGGTKLGTGGLAKAYGESAARALGAARPREQFKSRRLRIVTAFNDMGLVETLLAKNPEALLEVERSFGQESRFDLALKASRAEGFGTRVTEATAGRAVLTWEDEAPEAG